jgi:vacuolar-type H+-ATPase subunit E/Vma4
MEELQTTEVLEREILEDARKKAARILKTADDSINTKTAEWGEKITQAIDEIKKKYSEQNELNTIKIMARLPIDKLRIKAEKIESLIQTAADDWYKSLNRQKVIDLLTNEFSKRIAFSEEDFTVVKKEVYFSYLDQKEAETISKNSGLPSDIEWFKVTKGDYPSITLEANNIRIVASVQTIIDFYLQEKREELVEALVGRTFMGDA